MKTPSVSLLLGVSVLLLSGLTVSAVSLNVSPNLQQFFSGDSVSLSCADDGQTAGGQTVKRSTREGQTDQCGRHFGTINGSSCTVSPLSPSDSGGYWCETSSGQSLQVSITIILPDAAAADPYLLEIPALPVMTGSDVTLRCRTRSLGRVRASFFRDGGLLGSGPVEEFTLSNVQQSDAGLYWCVIDGVESPRSTLRVRAPPPPPRSTSSLYSSNSSLPPTDTSPPPPPPPPPSPPSSNVLVFILFCHLVVFCPYCISTGLLLSICCSRKTGTKAAVSMETTQPAGGGQGLDEEYDDITADVTTEHEF